MRNTPSAVGASGSMLVAGGWVTATVVAGAAPSSLEQAVANRAMARTATGKGRRRPDRQGMMGKSRNGWGR